jgi:hypothetical protein
MLPADTAEFVRAANIATMSRMRMLIAGAALVVVTLTLAVPVHEDPLISKATNAELPQPKSA